MTFIFGKVGGDNLKSTNSSIDLLNFVLLKISFVVFPTFSYIIHISRAVERQHECLRAVWFHRILDQNHFDVIDSTSQCECSWRFGRFFLLLNDGTFNCLKLGTTRSSSKRSGSKGKRCIFKFLLFFQFWNDEECSQCAEKLGTKTKKKRRRSDVD